MPYIPKKYKKFIISIYDNQPKLKGTDPDNKIVCMSGSEVAIKNNHNPKLLFLFDLEVQSYDIPPTSGGQTSILEEDWNGFSKGTFVLTSYHNIRNNEFIYLVEIEQ